MAVQDAAKAYKLGWDASRRAGMSGKHIDLDAAEDRFVARHGSRFEWAWNAGWIDYASDYEYGTGLKLEVN